MPKPEETLLDGPETVICNAIMALWQRGMFEAAYAPIRFIPIIHYREKERDIESLLGRFPYIIISPDQHLQSQFPPNLWVMFERSTVTDEIRRILEARSALIETLKLAEDDLRAKFEEVLGEETDQKVH